MEPPRAMVACSNLLLESLIHALDGNAKRFHLGRSDSSVMIQKFAIVRSNAGSELLNLNHISSSLILVSLLFPKFARERAAGWMRTSESSH